MMNTPALPMNILNPNLITRRSCLKGVTLGAGAVVLQPFLNALAADARGEAPPPRIVFVIEGNGLYPNHIQPTGVVTPREGFTSLVDRSLSELELPDPISPLAHFKNRMTILLGLSGRNVEPNHGGGYGVLGCYRGGTQGIGAVAQTLDHALAGSLPGIIPVLGLGVYGSPDYVFANTMSVIAPKRPMPIICQPEVAFQSLFGSVAEGNTALVFKARNKLLDWCRTDIKRVRNELPAMDREKLDLYLGTFEQMRAREDKLAAIKDRLKANLPATDKFASRVQTDRFEAHCALAASALASRLTNVVVLDASCGPHNYKTWRELGVTLDGHGIGHKNGPDEFSVPIRKYHAQRVADLAKRLDSIKEGNGTLLDNTLIVYMSDSAETHHGTGMNWPMVLVGNLGGRLKTAGRFLRFPDYNKTGHRTIANFYLSLLHAVGDKREKFGEPDLQLRDINTSGPLAEILA